MRVVVGDAAYQLADAEFRYIVVGGGSAGCLIARRLAERQAGTVALIEAGPLSSDVRTVVPNYYPRTFGSSLDWGYATEPQNGLAGRRIAWPRGKLLGGSGAINALIFLQAASDDFRRWGWHWAEDLLREANATNALLHHQRPATPHAWSEAFVRAAAESGLQHLEILDQSQANVCGLFSVAQHTGRRVHTGQSIETHENLTVYSASHVERVCIQDQRATGVILRGKQKDCTLNATDEVILCGGAIGSPLLLMASGIGNANDLQALEIDCQHHLSGVGGNLQDHLVFPVIQQTNCDAGLQRRHARRARDQFRRLGTGDLASNIAEAGALLGSPNDATVEFQIHFTPTHYLKYPRTATQGNHFSLAVTDLHPRSRGRLSVKHATGAGESASSHRNQVGLLTPCIDPAYLSLEEDVQRMLKAIAWARELAKQPSLRACIEQEVLPGANRQNAKSLTRTIQAFSQSIYHPVGTCRMVTSSQADSSDATVGALRLREPTLDSAAEETVVNSEFRVHGIQGLRVADASVIPDLPSGNTNAVTLLLAARAAELVLAGEKPTKRCSSEQA